MMSKDNISNKLPPKSFCEQKAQELLMGKRIIGVKYGYTIDVPVRFIKDIS